MPGVRIIPVGYGLKLIQVEGEVAVVVDEVTGARIEAGNTSRTERHKESKSLFLNCLEIGSILKIRPHRVQVSFT